VDIRARRDRIRAAYSDDEAAPQPQPRVWVEISAAPVVQPRPQAPRLDTAFWAPNSRRPIKGFHLSSDGGIAQLAMRYSALRKAVSGPLGVQHFVGSPKCGTHHALTNEEVSPFRAIVGSHARTWTVHASHATNLVSANP
jgi:hypothetical protein